MAGPSFHGDGPSRSAAVFGTMAESWTNLIMGLVKEELPQASYAEGVGQLARQVADAGVTSLALITTLGPYLTTENDAERTRAISALAEVGACDRAGTCGVKEWGGSERALCGARRWWRQSRNRCLRPKRSTTWPHSSPRGCGTGERRAAHWPAGPPEPAPLGLQARLRPLLKSEAVHTGPLTGRPYAVPCAAAWPWHGAGSRACPRC